MLLNHRLQQHCCPGGCTGQRWGGCTLQLLLQLLQQQRRDASLLRLLRLLRLLVVQHDSLQVHGGGTGSSLHQCCEGWVLCHHALQLLLPGLLRELREGRRCLDRGHRRPLLLLLVQLGLLLGLHQHGSKASGHRRRCRCHASTLLLLHRRLRRCRHSRLLLRRSPRSRLQAKHAIHGSHLLLLLQLGAGGGRQGCLRVGHHFSHLRLIALHPFHRCRHVLLLLVARHLRPLSHLRVQPRRCRCCRCCAGGGCACQLGGPPGATPSAALAVGCRCHAGGGNAGWQHGLRGSLPAQAE